MISRAINHLYPLEIRATSDIEVDSCTNNITSNEENLTRPPRTAGIKACEKISKQLVNQPVMITFFYPGECH